MPRTGNDAKEDVELLGRWWRPPDEASAVGGILRFSHRQGSELELIGALSELQPFTELEACPLILGITRDGKEVTLVGCQEVHRSHSLTAGFPHQRWRADTAYLGAHFDDQAELRFRKASIQFTYLPEWARRFGLGWQHSGEDAQGITCTKPQTIEAVTSRGKFSLKVTAVPEWEGLVRAGLRQSIWIDAELNEEVPLENWESRVVFPLQNLLTLGTSTPNALTELSVYSRHSVHERSTGEEVQLPISVLRQPVYHGERDDRLRHPSDMLFTLEDIEGSFAHSMERWLTISEQHRMVCELFFSIQYVPMIYAEHRFLNMVFACETYHRALAQKNFDLAQRLRDLVERHLGVIEPLVEDKNRFIDRVVATRKALVHGDAAQRQRAVITGRRLFYLARTLSYLIKAFLLAELGFSQERIARLFNRNRDYLYAVKEAGATSDAED